MAAAQAWPSKLKRNGRPSTQKSVLRGPNDELANELKISDKNDEHLCFFGSGKLKGLRHFLSINEQGRK